MRRSRRSLTSNAEAEVGGYQLGDTCTVKCGGGNAVGNSSGTDQKQSFTIQCVPAENKEEPNNRWVVEGTSTLYKEEDIELDCPSKEIL